jgi:Protein of unknown function (DUF4229)
MAERDGTAGPAVPVGPTGEPATRPKVWPWLLLYTGGRIVIAVVLVLVLWVAGLGSYAGLLFGVLLSMPVAYLALRPVRERLNEAIVAWQEERTRSKQELRARLSGDED